MMNGVTQALDFNAEALKLRAERQKVIASNIANADTPGFKAMDFDFGKALAQASGALSASSASAAVLATTAPGHIGTSGDGAVLAQLKYRSVTQPSLDGNTVDMDVEQAKFADNTVRYEASLRFLNGQIRTLTSAITGQG